MMAMAGGMLAVTSCSDFSDYNEVPGAYNASADKTLWENISGNANLSDFAAVLQRVGYDKVLNASHTYTVWAPVNGSFNVDSLANISDDKVRKEFVENLIADYAHKETDVNDTTIYMLNEKLMKFGNKTTGSLTFDAKKVIQNVNDASVYNYPSSNGLLYTVENPSTFRYNGYEIISEMSGQAEQFAALVKRFERQILDEKNSVKGEIIDGLQHYDDSVMIVTNELTSGIMGAQLTNEDSLYTIVIPNNDAWTSSYNKIVKYYNYLPSMTYQDLQSTAVGSTKGGSTTTSNATIMNPTTGAATVSLTAAPADAEIQETAAYWTDSITKNYIVNKLAFSETNKRYNSKLQTGERFAENDTLCTASRSYVTNLSLLDNATVGTIQLSNGHARIVNAYPFEEKTYLPKVTARYSNNPDDNWGRVVTATGTGVLATVVTNVPSYMWQPEENETSFTFASTQVPSNSSFAPEMDFYLSNVRSATYDVYVVMVPATLDANASSPVLPEDMKPYSLRVDINYTNASNVAVAGRFDGETVRTTANEIRQVKPFIVTCKNDAGLPKVDTLHVGRVTFPVCYVNTSAKPNIKVMHTYNSFLSSTKRNYEQNLRIASVVLKPVYENEENATKED